MAQIATQHEPGPMHALSHGSGIDTEHLGNARSRHLLEIA
jgi:hypothetical protein